MTISLDDGMSVDSVHVDSAMANPKRNMSITAAKRRSIPTREFAIPSQKKYPLDTAARTRNAAARLEQNKGGLSPAEYSAARSRIASAAKKFGINSEYNKAKKTRMSGGKGLHMKIAADGSMSIRHMGEADRCVAFLPLQPIDESTFSEAVNMADATPKLVWNKLAIPGTFMGHPSGPFKMDSKTFSEIVKNFDTDGIKVPFDYEHASEAPVAGNAPKGRGDVVPSGWIHKLDSRSDGLYGAVEWLPEARKKILAGEFKYISPAIRFGAVDGKSGKDIGAKLSSAAIVLKPFLKDLPEVRAADAAKSLQMSEQADGTELVFICSEISGQELRELADSSGYAIHPNEFLSRFRRMLNLDDLASPNDMLDKMDRLSDLCGMAGGNPSAVIEGIPLSNYIQPMRDYMRMPANTTLDELLDAVCEMICSTIETDNESTGADMSDMVSVEAPIPTTLTAPVITKKETIPMDPLTITLSEHEAKVASAVSAAVNAATETATAPLVLKSKQLEASISELTTKLSESESLVVKLNDEMKKRDAAAQDSRIEEAFSTYKESHKLTDLHKKAMKATLLTDAETFEALYPKLAPAQAVLLRTVTSPDTTTATVGATKVIPDLNVLLADAQQKNPSKTYDQCFDLALAEQTKLMAG